MKKVIREISLIKTLRFNFHYFKFKDAIRLPVIVSRHVLINNLRGRFDLKVKYNQVVYVLDSEVFLFLTGSGAERS